MKEQVRELATEVWQTSHWTSEQIKRLERFANLVRNAALDEAAEYLEGVHQSRLVKFAEAIRNIKEHTP